MFCADHSTFQVSVCVVLFHYRYCKINLCNVSHYRILGIVVNLDGETLEKLPMFGSIVSKNIGFALRRKCTDQAINTWEPIRSNHVYNTGT